MKPSNSISILQILVPITLPLKYVIDASKSVLFRTSIVALIPLAKSVGNITEHLAAHFGVTGGSILNVKFPNVSEIILSIIAIQSGLFSLVLANMTGSILG
jgi:Ca2+:H+ antiporter